MYKNGTYDRDLIAERDKKAQMVNGVIKWWNVHYTTPEDIGEEEISSTDVLNQSINNTTSNNDDFVSYDDDLSDAVDDLMANLTEEQAMAANDIIARLEREAAEDEAKKQAEIAAAMAQNEAGFDSDFNATTGSYSGAYGAGGVMDEYADQIGSILGEKDDYLKKMIEEAGE